MLRALFNLMKKVHNIVIAIGTHTLRSLSQRCACVSFLIVALCIVVVKSEINKNSINIAAMAINVGLSHSPGTRKLWVFIWFGKTRQQE